MARVTALIDDLLFGSKAMGLLGAAGHDVRLAPRVPDDLAATADVVVVDLTTGTIPDGVVLAGGPKVLGVFAHVEPEMRDRALAAGFDLVVPRSRFMRDGAALVARLAGADA
jgi:hypothetical protein